MASGDERGGDRNGFAPPPAGRGALALENSRTVKAHGNETSNPCKVRRWDSATGQPSTQGNGCQTYDTMAVLAQVTLPAAADGACRP